MGLMATDQVATNSDKPRILRNNLIELKLIQKLIQESPELAKIDPSLFQDMAKEYGTQSYISKLVYAHLISQLTKMSNFPTLVATNISKKCYNDSQEYYKANLLLLKWANQSI